MAMLLVFDRMPELAGAAAERPPLAPAK